MNWPGCGRYRLLGKTPEMKSHMTLQASAYHCICRSKVLDSGWLNNASSYLEKKLFKWLESYLPKISCHLQYWRSSCLQVSRCIRLTHRSMLIKGRNFTFPMPCFDSSILASNPSTSEFFKRVFKNSRTSTHIGIGT